MFKQFATQVLAALYDKAVICLCLYDMLFIFLMFSKQTQNSRPWINQWYVTVHTHTIPMWFESQRI